MELPVLTNPADFDKILEGYEAIDQDGRVIVGEMPDHSGNLVLVLADLENERIMVPRGFHDGFTGVAVQVEGVSVTPGDTQQVIYPTDGKVIGKVTVEAVPGGGDGEEWYITDGSYLFYDKSGRAAIARYLLPLCKGLTNMKSMFQNSWLDDPEVFAMIGDLDTSKVTNMESFMASAGNAGSLDLSKWDTSKCTNMKNMFSGWYALEGIILPENFGSAATDMSGMFSTNRRLVNLDLRNMNVSNVTNMSGMLKCEAAETIDIRGWDTSKVTNMNSLFSTCLVLTEIKTDGLNTSNVTDMASLFNNAKKITWSTISELFENMDTSNVKTMSSMFSTCQRLERVDMSNIDTRAVTSGSGMFSNCNSLAEILGFSLAGTSSSSSPFPKGSTTTATAALNRLTFRTDYEDGVYSYRGPIDIKYCSFDREGMVEMFNTLPDISSLSLSSSYKRITLTGNPCVLSEFTVPASLLGDDEVYTTLNTYDEYVSYVKRQYRYIGYENAPLKYYLDGQSALTDAVEGTFSDITEDMFAAGPLHVHLKGETVTVPEEMKLTSEDRLIATDKGWTLVG